MGQVRHILGRRGWILGVLLGTLAMTLATPSALALDRLTLPFSWGLPQPLVVGEENTQAQVACVRLDGYCLVRVAAPRGELYRRVQTIEQTLGQVRNDYLQAAPSALILEIRQPPPPEPSPGSSPEATGEEPRRTPEIHLGVDPRQLFRLMSVTRFDALLKGVDGETAAEILIDQIEAGLVRSRFERQPDYWGVQLGVSLFALISGIALNWSLSRWGNALERRKQELKDALAPVTAAAPSLANLLEERQQWNTTEAQLRFSQLSRGLIWVGGSLFILSRFPATRLIQVRILQGFNIPLRLALVALGIYVAIRLSFAAINHIASIFASSYQISIEGNRRMQLRVRTISRVSQGMIALLWLGIGGLVVLSSLGVSLAPLLAGAGILGVALSLPAQSLIKDAINGFFIILEDQYAVGDIITVHSIRGLVENINLRITQIRDEEGRLVSIPNSEIGVVANHSSHWAQADIHIPISYTTDIDGVLALIETQGREMQVSDRWRDILLSTPEVLGIEEFDERGLTIRVWIKTQPLQQWAVAREYRRRLKIALDAAGIIMPAHIDFKTPPEE